ncbi:FMN-linked oxidoreductase [Acephala macrosclerotiorum]|nr:FMN-linked oxidoreductase [Acephala macrosclerotiorum]
MHSFLALLPLVASAFAARPFLNEPDTGIEDVLGDAAIGTPLPLESIFFISPCARAGYARREVEAGLIRSAAAGGILYMPALYATLSIEQITAAKPANNIWKRKLAIHEVYLGTNLTASQAIFKRAENASSKAIIFTVDSAVDGNRHCAARYGVGSADTSYSYMTWDVFHTFQNLTSLPIIPKVALEIHEKAPEVFTQIEVYADGGVRYGADVLKLLSLGVKAVGLGRPFMFANTYGQKDVEKAIGLLKHEIAIDAGNLGVGDLKKINPSFVSWTNNNWYS